MVYGVTSLASVVVVLVRSDAVQLPKDLDVAQLVVDG